jgi:predicted nucleic acid-binding protein
VSKRKVYLDSGVIIELVKHKVDSAKLQADRADHVWYVDALLEAARNNEVDVLTSSLSIVECVSVGDQQKEQSAREFFVGLLESGRSGIKLIQPTSSIQLKARDLRWLSGLSLKGFDSIHAASALFFRCDELLTLDTKFFSNSDKLQNMGLRVIDPAATTCLPDHRRQQKLLS